MRKLTLFNKNTKYILSLLCICISSVQAEDSTTLTTSGDDIQASLQHDQFNSDPDDKGDAISPIRTRSLVLTKWQAATVLTIIVCVLGAGAYWKLSAKKQIGPKPNPAPVNPTPVDPTPVDPTPVDPTPVDPASVEDPETEGSRIAKLMEKVADHKRKIIVGIIITALCYWFFFRGSRVIPRSADPTPVDPTPVDPTPVDPAPVDPAPVDFQVAIEASAMRAFATTNAFVKAFTELETAAKTHDRMSAEVSAAAKKLDAAEQDITIASNEIAAQIFDSTPDDLFDNPKQLKASKLEASLKRAVGGAVDDDEVKRRALDYIGSQFNDFTEIVRQIITDNSGRPNNEVAAHRVHAFIIRDIGAEIAARGDAPESDVAKKFVRKFVRTATLLSNAKKFYATKDSANKFASITNKMLNATLNKENAADANASEHVLALSKKLAGKKAIRNKFVEMADGLITAKFSRDNLADASDADASDAAKKHSAFPTLQAAADKEIADASDADASDAAKKHSAFPTLQAAADKEIAAQRDAADKEIAAQRDAADKEIAAQRDAAQRDAAASDVAKKFAGMADRLEKLCIKHLKGIQARIKKESIAYVDVANKFAGLADRLKEKLCIKHLKRGMKLKVERIQYLARREEVKACVRKHKGK